MEAELATVEQAAVLMSYTVPKTSPRCSWASQASARPLASPPSANSAAGIRMVVTRLLASSTSSGNARIAGTAGPEMVRVTVPGGLVAIALIPRWSLLRRTLSIPDERARLADGAFIDALLTRGEFTNLHPGRFSSGFGADPSEMVETFATAGFRQILFASTHGFATGLESALDELRVSDPTAYEAALDLLARTATDPSFHGTAGAPALHRPHRSLSNSGT